MRYFYPMVRKNYSDDDLDKIKSGNTSTFGADAPGANLRFADLGGMYLQSANLEGADLTGAKLTGANLGGANLNGASLNGAKLKGARLHSADLRGADLRDADLSGAYLLNVQLHGAKLTGANLGGADLYGVVYDDLTVWPKDFTPPPSKSSSGIPSTALLVGGAAVLGLLVYAVVGSSKNERDVKRLGY